MLPPLGTCIMPSLNPLDEGATGGRPCAQINGWWITRETGGSHEEGDAAVGCACRCRDAVGCGCCEKEGESGCAAASARSHRAANRADPRGLHQAAAHGHQRSEEALRAHRLFAAPQRRAWPAAAALSSVV